MKIDSKRRSVLAKQVKGRMRAHWQGGGGNIHTRILRMIKQVLLEDTAYLYLQPQAKERLASARQLAKSCGLENKIVISLSETRHCIFPRLGTIPFRILNRFLELVNPQQISIAGFTGLSPYYLSPYYLVINTNTAVSATAMEDAALSACSFNFSAESLMQEDEVPELEKYDEFVPATLLRQASTSDQLDIDSLKKDFCIRFSQLQKNADQSERRLGRE